MAGNYERKGIVPPAERLQLLAGTLTIPVYKLFKQSPDVNPVTDLTGIDARSAKKLRDILSPVR
jgi:transcriptional regulator with XRE-family HTH domain